MRALLDRLSSKDENIRLEASIIIERTVKPEDALMLSRALKGKYPDAFAQTAVVRALGKTGEFLAVDPLQAEFVNGGHELKMAIVDAMTALRGEQAIPWLADLLAQRKDIELLKRVVASLGKIGGAKAKYVLEGFGSQIRHPVLRRTISFALNYMTGTVGQAQTDEDFKEGMRQVLQFKGMQYLYYHPFSPRDETFQPWLLVCVHGSDLDADAVYQLCYPLAKELKLAVVVPLFDNLRFPDFPEFNLRGERTDALVLDLVDFLSAKTGVKRREFYMFGYEWGGEFVQRFVFAYPRRIARAAFSASGFITPDPKVYFPQGLKASLLAPEMEFRMADIVKTDFAILITGTISASKVFRSFYAPLVKYVNDEQISSRVRVRTLKDNQSDLGAAWNVARGYLFPVE
jgi:pimeloyl-ACP methyl ester carboxylesterase